MSSVRGNVAVSDNVFYTVEAEWPGDTLVAISVANGRVSLGVDSSTTTVVTVENLGNAEVYGTLNGDGQDTGLVLFNWVRMSDNLSTGNYTLASGSSEEFLLTITSNTARSGFVEYTITARSNGDGVARTDRSVPLSITIEGPALPPNGLSLPLGVSAYLSPLPWASWGRVGSWPSSRFNCFAVGHRPRRTAKKQRRTKPRRRRTFPNWATTSVAWTVNRR